MTPEPIPQGGGSSDHLKIHPLIGEPAHPGADGRIATLEMKASFGWTRRDRAGKPRMHRGCDWYTRPGTPVFAAHAGVVLRHGEQEHGKGFGQRIYLHGGGVLTIYAHLSGQNVATGDIVRAGHLIGWTGRSGNITTEDPHLHFEVRLGGEGKGFAVNPEWWLHGYGARSGEERMA